MKSVDRDILYGRTVPECISGFVGELNYDAVGLWQIVAAGKHRFLKLGDELIEFVKSTIHALLDAGAVPVRFGGPTHDWVLQRQYGTENESIATNVLDEWTSYGALQFDELQLYGYGVWFAKPREHPRYILYP